MFNTILFLNVIFVLVTVNRYHKKFQKMYYMVYYCQCVTLKNANIDLILSVRDVTKAIQKRLN